MQDVHHASDSEFRSDEPGSDPVGDEPGSRHFPRFREMLTVAEDAQLEGTVTTPEAAMSLVRDRFGKPEVQGARF